MMGSNPIWTRALGSPSLPPKVQRSTFMVVCVRLIRCAQVEGSGVQGFLHGMDKKGMFSWRLKKEDSYLTSAGTSQMRRLLQWSPHSSIMSQPRGRKQRDEKDQRERNCCCEHAGKETFHISLIDALCFGDAN